MFEDMRNREAVWDKLELEVGRIGSGVFLAPMCASAWWAGEKGKVLGLKGNWMVGVPEEGNWVCVCFMICVVFLNVSA